MKFVEFILYLLNPLNACQGKRVTEPEPAAVLQMKGAPWTGSQSVTGLLGLPLRAIEAYRTVFLVFSTLHIIGVLEIAVDDSQKAHSPHVKLKGFPLQTQSPLNPRAIKLQLQVESHLCDKAQSKTASKSHQRNFLRSSKVAQLESFNMIKKTSTLGLKTSHDEQIKQILSPVLFNKQTAGKNICPSTENVAF